MISRLLTTALATLGAAAGPLSTSPQGASLRRAQTLTLAPVFLPTAEVAHNAINGSWIVYLKKDCPASALNDHVAMVQSAHARSAAPTNDGIRHVYDSHIKGYAGLFSDDVIEQLRANPDVDYIEQDQRVYAVDIQTQRSSPWGLARISHRKKLSLGTFNKYAYDTNGGDGVDVYVIDTGVNVNHVEFEGRAIWGKTVPRDASDVDNNGHGTHCAGTIASRKYGVAKAANVIAVKVLGDNGSGSMSDVVAGVTWAADAAAKKMKQARQEFAQTGKTKHKGSVANMSLGGGKSRALDDAVNAAVEGGLHMAVAAGNDNRDACNYSPAAAEKAVTVGASTVADERAYFSNHGECVDIFAPGLNILSTWIGSDDATNSISGTSMASPHTAGLLAYLLSLYPNERFNPELEIDIAPPRLNMHGESSPMQAVIPGWLRGMWGVVRRFGVPVPAVAAPIPGGPGTITPAQLKKALIALGTRDVLTDLPAKTPNILIFNNVTSS
ncbi:hypothetical protein AURDEDRAFT_115386 [Auricularia subglabra TFB-10046 SS5]|nr:hypothetical protein AURDEDRAFT_115386 [Auricularia subglabra TFB-10046 SS5]